MDIQSDQLNNILKWVGIAFAGGFVGYFGRHLSKVIIARLHKGKNETPAENTATAETIEQQASAQEKARSKLEKKRLKLEQKQQKKDS